MKARVLLDSCVLIASSVYMASESIGISLKHKFFDESMNLIGLLRKNIAKRIGIVTPTVEDEAHLVLEKAVKEELTSKNIDQFKFLSIVLNSCESRLKEILDFLLRELIEPSERDRWFIRINDMYEELTRYGRELDVGERASVRTEAVSKGYKKEAYKIYARQEFQLNRQAIRLVKNPPDYNDKLILSEATYLLNLYKQAEGRDITLFLCSTDFHFSPTKDEPPSRVVTKTIQDRFGVICDWPDQVAREIRRAL